MCTLTNFSVICGVFLVITPSSPRVIYEQQSSPTAVSYSYRVEHFPVHQPPKMLQYTPTKGVVPIPVVLQLYLTPKACPFTHTKNEQTEQEVTSVGPEVEENNPPDNDAEDGIANSR